jgi:nucleoside-diphosphate-sugar epimerase
LLALSDPLIGCPVIDLRPNVQGTLDVLQKCIKHRVPRLLYARSMTVYGSDSPLPTAEEPPCVLTIAQRVDPDFEFRVTAFRMYKVYGPRQDPYQGVLGHFSWQPSARRADSDFWRRITIARLHLHWRHHRCLDRRA